MPDDWRPGSRRRVPTAVIPIAAVGLAIAGAGLAVWAHAGGTADRVSAVALAVTIALIALTGCVVTLARPGNRVGWLIIATGCAWGVGEGLFDAGVRGIVTAPGTIPAASALAVVGGPVRAAGWLGAAIAVPVVFPDGRLPGSRWRWLAWTALAAVAASFVGTALATDVENTELRAAGWHNPIALPGALAGFGDAVSTVSLPLMIATIAGGVAALTSRWRTGTTPIRRQLLTFAAGAALPVIVVPTAFGFGADPWVFAVAVVPVPIAVAVAILTGGMFDMATVANRSLVWVTLSAAIVGIYVLVVAGTGALLGDTGAHWLPWLGAGVVAVSFAPLRHTLHEAANRITYGAWRQPYDVLAGLGPRISYAMDASSVLSTVVTELHATLGLEGVALRDPDGRIVAGAPGAAPTLVPLTVYGRRAGDLLYTEPATALRPADRRVLDDLATQLAVLMHARALTDDLRHARERLVLAREEERRRLRRDLHDGLGPALAGLMLKVDNARALIPEDPTAATRDLLVLRDDIRHTVEDVRRLVEGLRPPAIDELGLAAAVAVAVNRLASASGTAVEIAVDPLLPAVPAAVEVAVYRIACEAVTNAIKHAAASRCHVAITIAGRSLVLRVADDGRGIDTPAALFEPVDARPGGGNGLATMRERAEELGGALDIAGTDAGTTVTAILPLPAAGSGAGSSAGSGASSGASSSASSSAESAGSASGRAGSGVDPADRAAVPVVGMPPVATSAALLADGAA